MGLLLVLLSHDTNAREGRHPLVRELSVLGGHAHEPRRLRVKVRGFRKTQIQVADALAKGAEAGLPPPAAQQVGLPVHQLGDVSGKPAVKLADGPLEVQQDVEALFDAQERSFQGFVQVLEASEGARERGAVCGVRCAGCGVWGWGGARCEVWSVMCDIARETSISPREEEEEECTQTGLELVPVENIIQHHIIMHHQRI